MNLSQLYSIIEKMQYDELGKYTRDKRQEIGVSLNNFALNSGIEPATLSNFETGKSGISFDTIVKIANGFNLTLGEFITQYEKTFK